MRTKEAEGLLPGFANAFNTEAVKMALEGHLRKSGEESRIAALEISDVKYEPGSRCVILYKTTLAGKYDAGREQLFLGKVLRKDEEAKGYPKKAIFSRELGIVFSPFPHDPSMSWLPEASTGREMEKKLRRALGRGWEISELEIKLLAYTPEMRATFLYSFEAAHKGTKEKLSLQWIAKTNVHRSPHRVFANYWALWQAANGAIPMPKPTGFLINPAMTFQEKIGGIRLGAIVDAPNLVQIIEDLALLIARFHQLRFPIRNSRGKDQEIRTLTKWSNVLINLRPDLKNRMEALRQNIIREMETRIQTEAPIHADFHHTNVLVDGERVQIIDMDEMAFGDPCLDVGRFLSSLRIPSLRVYGSFEGLRPARELFIETYLNHSPRERGKIHLFESAALFTSAASAFRLNRSNWENEVPMLLAESEEAFRKSKAGKPLALGFPAQKEYAFSKEENLKWAEDEMLVKTLLAPFYYDKYESEIVSCKYKERSEKKGFYKFSYLVQAKEKAVRLKDTVELFIHKGKEIRFLFDYAVFLQNSLFGSEGEHLFPRPLGYLPEIGALAFHAAKGTALAHCLDGKEGTGAADRLAGGLDALHRLAVPVQSRNRARTRQPFKTEEICFESKHPKAKEFIRCVKERKKHVGPRCSFVLKDLNLFDVKVAPDSLQIAFPIRKNIGHPFAGIGSFAKEVILYGLRKGKEKECEKFLDAFFKAYATRAGVEIGDLIVFAGEALIPEVHKSILPDDFEKIASNLLTYL